MADVVAAGKFLKQELAQYDSTFYSTTYPEYWGAMGKYHPAVGDLMVGAKEVVAARVDEVGEAKIYDGQADDIPFADFGITEERYKARLVVSGAKWSIFDIAAAEMANGSSLLPQRNLLDTKMRAVNRAMQRRVHKLVWAGDAKQGMQGLFSAADINIEDEATDLYALSPDDLYDYFVDLIGDFQDETLLTAEATMAYIPKKLHTALMKRFTQNGDGNPYKLLTTNGDDGFVGGITVMNELKSTFLEAEGVQPAGTNKDRIMLGSMDDANAIRRQFFATARTAPQLSPNGIEYRMTAYCATSEVQVREPFRFKYIDIPRAA